MNEITIYNVEKELGLEDKIKAQSSIAFVSPILKLDSEAKNESQILDISKASALTTISSMGYDVSKDPLLHHVYSILVSTVWNKNDDIFDKAAVWAARKTPIFKPTNLDHDETKLIGTMINSWPVDSDMNLIAEDTSIEDLPDDYHLLVDSVIYKQWQSPELQNRVDTLIAEIESGEKYVSMECVFSGFDYGIIGPDGAVYDLPRTSSTAFLSKHLRAYGGEGVYDGYRIGRILKNVVFSGKGYVDKPANPDSVIFDKDYVVSFANVKSGKDLDLNKNGVTSVDDKQQNEFISTKEKEQMSENQNILNEQLKELKDAYASLQSENKRLAEENSKANISQYENKITELESSLAMEKNSKEEMKKKMDEEKSKSENLEKELSEVTESMNKMKGECDKMKKDAMMKERKDKMAKSGISDEQIEETYQAFSSMSDEQFEAAIKLLSQASTSETSTEDSSASESNEEETETSEASELVEDDEEGGSHSVSSEQEESELDSARASLANWASELFSSKK